MPSPPPPRAGSLLARRDHNGFVAPTFLESKCYLFNGSEKSGVYLGAETCLPSVPSFSRTVDKTTGFYKAQVYRALHSYSIV
jgi:hypothetical protein